MASVPSVPIPKLSSFTKTWHSEPYPFISPTRPELSAAGKNVVITGGGTGIGKAIGIAFAEAGARSVAVIGRRLDRLRISADSIGAAGHSTQVLLETGDLTDRKSIESALKNIVSKVGKIDIFVANAGVLPREEPVSTYDEGQLRASLETNVMGPFHSLQAFLPLASPGAQVFNVGSSIGHWQPQPEVPGAVAYASAKMAAFKIFDYFASENPDIHVVTMHPGIVATEINPAITVAPDTGMVSDLHVKRFHEH